MRAQLHHLVTTSVGTTIQIANQAIVTVRRTSDDSLATLYEASTGINELANPLEVDSFGRATAWVEMDKYTLQIEGTGVNSYTEYWDATPADQFAAYGKGFVHHDANAGAARPVGFASVEWIGSVPPVNAISLDTWINTGNIAVVANVFDAGWPTRPDGPVVIWVGGADPGDDPAALMEDSDLWFPDGWVAV